MKASLKLRDEAGPLLRAKLPVALFSVPAVASLTAGDPADLRLSLATAAQALPSLRLSYAPNRPAGSSPFSLSLVLGSGPGGCPSSGPAGASAITMAVEVSAAGAVSFSLALKPSLGDFNVRKRFESAGGAGGTSPSEVTMRSVVPVRGGAAAVRIRWGVRIPAEITATGEAGAAGVILRRLPFLVLGKVTVETLSGKPAPEPEAAVQEEAAVQKVRTENEKLRKEVEKLRATPEEGSKKETSVLAGARRDNGGRSPEMVGN
ncbi:uncharacterized protein LOC124651342 [Lolium rigidum]|uniref:uncharacterized protein LOC124651342 n=1 Tax=Lolium rigidum TaxID=89674 RepID=UPI001F5CC8AC|nr:uncharacterized protein LOC124651342 [Lolium rigidum]